MSIFFPCLYAMGSPGNMPQSTDLTSKAPYHCHVLYNSLRPVVVAFEYVNPAELQDWIFVVLQRLLTPAPTYVDPKDLRFVGCQ